MIYQDEIVSRIDFAGAQARAPNVMALHPETIPIYRHTIPRQHGALFCAPCKPRARLTLRPQQMRPNEYQAPKTALQRMPAQSQFPWVPP
jgi:hypothetical protein